MGQSFWKEVILGLLVRPRGQSLVWRPTEHPALAVSSTPLPLGSGGPRAWSQESPCVAVPGGLGNLPTVAR